MGSEMCIRDRSWLLQPKGSLLTFGPNHSRTPPVYNILHARTSMRTLILSLTSPWFLMCVYAMHMFSIVLLFVEQLLVALLFCGQLPVASGRHVLNEKCFGPLADNDPPSTALLPECCQHNTIAADRRQTLHQGARTTYFNARRELNHEMRSSL